MGFETLKISKKVMATTEDTSEITPASGKIVTILRFRGSAPSSLKSTVKLIWDYGGVGERELWTIEGNDVIPRDEFSDEVLVGDGTKILAVTLDNGESSDVFMTGSAKIFVKD